VSITYRTAAGVRIRRVAPGTGASNHARASSWSFIDDIQQGQMVRTQSSGLFNCTSGEFKVQYLKYLNNSDPTAVVGTATLRAPAGG
jgi:uncharacterized cupin superfamily protein